MSNESLVGELDPVVSLKKDGGGLTEKEKITLCAVANNITLDNKHKIIARDLIRRGLIEVHVEWRLTDAGFKAAEIMSNDTKDGGSK
jgi:hypothetical protein